MNQKNQDEDDLQQDKVERTPNEQFGFYFSGVVKITDPQTGEILVTKRTD